MVLEVVPSTAPFPAAHRNPHQLLQTSRRDRAELAPEQCPRLFFARLEHSGRGYLHLFDRARRILLSLERPHAALARLFHSTAGITSRASPIPAAYPKLRRPPNLRHALRHLRQPARAG